MSDLDRYELQDLLGSGATSEVFVAVDKKLRRKVAFKRLVDHVASDPTVRRCFHREAQALAKIRHKNVVAVHDYSGQDSHTLYLVMDRVEGKTLETRLQENGALDEPVLWSVLHEITAGLTACHAQNVVHRDLKPENVIVSNAGRLSIVDFGIARSFDKEDQVIGASAGTQVMGTPDFMSPEQATSNELTGASDVFSLGSVMYFLATGQRPFAAETMLATFKRIVAGNYVPPKQLRPNLSNEMNTLIADCLRVDAGSRPNTSELLKRAKENLLLLGVTADNVLSDWAKGSMRLSQNLSQAALDLQFQQLEQALAAKDKKRAQQVRKRILELDPDNTRVFEMHHPSDVNTENESPQKAQTAAKSQAEGIDFTKVPTVLNPIRERTVIPWWAFAMAGLGLVGIGMAATVLLLRR